MPNVPMPTISLPSGEPIPLLGQGTWAMAEDARRRPDEIAALLLCSRVLEDVGHVTQLCVSRQYRRRGLGAWLLAECSRTLRSRGFQALTLTVTQQNADAVALYHRSGFVTRQTFDAMVWDRRPRPRT